MTEDTAESLKDAIRVDAGQLRGHIDEAVRSSVEETLNGLLDAEADRICGAERRRRSRSRWWRCISQEFPCDESKEPEDLLAYRSVAQPSDRGRFSVRVPRRRRAQAQLGR